MGLTVSAQNPVGDIIEGKIVKIHDGDTITLLLPGNKQLKIKLAEIDAPEKNQPHYQDAKQALADRVFVEMVSVEIVAWEGDDVAVGRVSLDGESINAWMVDEGHAWVDRQHSEDPELLELEASARAGNRGIWALSIIEQVPPWEWRTGKRIGTREDKVIARPYTCGTKNFCREMTSCDEAKYYLEQCYLIRLDDNKDGVPCDSLCK